MEQITHITRVLFFLIGCCAVSQSQAQEEDITLMVYATPSAIDKMGGDQMAIQTIDLSVKNFNDAVAYGGIEEKVQVATYLQFSDDYNICKRTLLNNLTSSNEIPRINEDRQMYRGDVVLVIIDDDLSCGISGYSSSKSAAFIVLHYACLGANFSLPRQLAYLLEAGNENDQSGVFSFFAPNGRAYTALDNDGDAVFTTILGYTDDALSSNEDDFIMIPYFSDPNLTYQDYPVGTNAENNMDAITKHWKYVSNYMNNKDSYALYESSLEEDEEVDLYCEATLLFQDFVAEEGSKMVIDSERVVFEDGVKFVVGSSVFKKRRIEGDE